MGKEQQGETTSDGLTVEIDSMAGFVSVTFNREVMSFTLSLTDARHLARCIMEKAAEAESISADLASDWIVAELDFESTSNLKGILEAVEDVASTKKMPRAFRDLKIALGGVLKDTNLLDTIERAIELEVEDQEHKGDVKRRLMLGSDATRRSVCLLEWIALLPTVPPPKIRPRPA